MSSWELHDDQLRAVTQLQLKELPGFPSLVHSGIPFAGKPKAAVGLARRELRASIIEALHQPATQRSNRRAVPRLELMVVPRSSPVRTIWPPPSYGARAALGRNETRSGRGRPCMFHVEHPVSTRKGRARDRPVAAIAAESGSPVSYLPNLHFCSHQRPKHRSAGMEAPSWGLFVPPGTSVSRPAKAYSNGCRFTRKLKRANEVDQLASQRFQRMPFTRKLKSHRMVEWRALWAVGPVHVERRALANEALGQRPHSTSGTAIASLESYIFGARGSRQGVGGMEGALGLLGLASGGTPRRD